MTTIEPSPPASVPAQPVPLTPNPGQGLGIAGFVLSFFFFLDIVGLILSIVGLVKSRRAGHRNGFAVAGIIIASLGVLGLIIVVSVTAPLLVNAGQECARLGYGVHHVGNAVYTCTPTSFNVSY